MRPFIAEQGRARLIVNEFPDSGCLTLDIDGAGVTMFPDREQCLAIAAVLISIAKRIGERKP